VAGPLAKREQVRNFRKWIGDNLPKEQAERAWQLLESLVFISNPNLAGTLFYETRKKPGKPLSEDYPKDGIGFYIDSDTNTAYMILKWQEDFYTVITGVANKLAVITAFLPLIAGSAFPLTDMLHIHKASNPGVVMREEGEESYVALYEADDSMILTRNAATGPAYMDLAPVPFDGVSDGIVRVLRWDMAVGPLSGFNVYWGDETDTLQHEMLARGDAKLCQEAGDLRLGGNAYVTLPTTEPADGELENGQAVFWVQET
jgi:hypothetical protein